MSLVTGGCVVSYLRVCRQSLGGVSVVKRDVSIDRAFIYCLICYY